jgi:F420-0:gamma-glutamyl ligase-like protein
MDELKSNPGKNLIIQVNGVSYYRLPIKTHLITQADNISNVVVKYVKPHSRANDILFISERIVAISQGRAFPIKDIKPSWPANFLVKFVHKSPHGIGLGSAWTMELALREAGALRIIFAAIISAITKLFGIRGLFYKIAGNNINAIDGPCDYTLPPYNKYAKLGPKDPQKVAQELSEQINLPVVIIDANDLGVAILGKSSLEILDDFCKQIFRDNPLGQSNEQTPLCLVRRVN